jgi:hypothetical protein
MNLLDERKIRSAEMKFLRPPERLETKEKER